MIRRRRRTGTCRSRRLRWLSCVRSGKRSRKRSGCANEAASKAENRVRAFARDPRESMEPSEDLRKGRGFFGLGRNRQAIRTSAAFVDRQACWQARGNCFRSQACSRSEGSWSEGSESGDSATWRRRDGATVAGRERAEEGFDRGGEVESGLCFISEL